MFGRGLSRIKRLGDVRAVAKDLATHEALSLFGSHGSVIHFPDATAYSGDKTAASGTTALDLSSIVGSRKAFVYLRIENGGVTNADLWIRTNGQTLVDYQFGTQRASSRNGAAIHLSAITDSAGIIEWGVSADVTAMSIIVESYSHQ